MLDSENYYYARKVTYNKKNEICLGNYVNLHITEI